MHSWPNLMHASPQLKTCPDIVLMNDIAKNLKNVINRYKVPTQMAKSFRCAGDSIQGGPSVERAYKVNST